MSIRKSILFIAVITALNALAQDRLTGNDFATRSEVIAKNGMVATSQPLATQVGLEILKQGGSAVDAAIAANAMLGLVEPTGCGIGGDLFAIVWDAENQRLYGLNASGRSPYEMNLEYLKKQGFDKIPAHGPLPVTVPGCVDGWFELHGKFGKLPMSELLSPAIEYAEEGFPVSELIAYYMELNSRVLKDYKNFRNVFMRTGRTPAKGEIFKNPDLANTYRRIASEGRDVFYNGELTAVMVDYLREKGGFHTLKDFQDHTSEWVDPVSTSYRGYEIWELPPNGQGIAALQILNILERYDIASMGFGSADYLHLFIEAKKLAYEDRARYYADPEFNEIPVEWLISKEYAAERQKLIQPGRASASYDAGELEQGNTIYLTTADKDGNMVSLIQSNYRGMGSGMSPPGLGFVFQDRGELFSLEEGHFNVFEPHKRPFHTIIPAFVTKDGAPFMSFGVMGGSMQPQGHVQVLINMIDFGMNLQEAGDAPRVRHSGSSQPTGEKMTDGGWLNMENGFNALTIRELIKMGHKIKFSVGGYGGYQAIMKNPDNGVYFGASESRKDGQAAGY